MLLHLTLCLRFSYKAMQQVRPSNRSKGSVVSGPLHFWFGRDYLNCPGATPIYGVGKVYIFQMDTHQIQFD